MEALIRNANPNTKFVLKSNKYEKHRYGNIKINRANCSLGLLPLMDALIRNANSNSNANKKLYYK